MNFKLRSFQENDLDSLVKYANNEKIAGNLTDQFPNPYTKEKGMSFIEMATQETPRKIKAIDINNEVVGAVGVHPKTDIHKKNAELGYWLAEPFWGRGIMTKAVTQMVDYGFEYFDINRIYAVPFENNIGSQKVLEKAGFVLEGRFSKTIYKNGKFLDELVYAVRRP